MSRSAPALGGALAATCWRPRRDRRVVAVARRRGQLGGAVGDDHRRLGAGQPGRRRHPVMGVDEQRPDAGVELTLEGARLLGEQPARIERGRHGVVAAREHGQVRAGTSHSDASPLHSGTPAASALSAARPVVTYAATPSNSTATTPTAPATIMPAVPTGRRAARGRAPAAGATCTSRVRTGDTEVAEPDARDDQQLRPRPLRWKRCRSPPSSAPTPSSTVPPVVARRRSDHARNRRPHPGRGRQRCLPGAGRGGQQEPVGRNPEAHRAQVGHHVAEPGRDRPAHRAVGDPRPDDQLGQRHQRGQHQTAGQDTPTEAAHGPPTVGRQAMATAASAGRRARRSR